MYTAHSAEHKCWLMVSQYLEAQRIGVHHSLGTGGLVVALSVVIVLVIVVKWGRHEVDVGVVPCREQGSLSRDVIVAAISSESYQEGY